MPDISIWERCDNEVKPIVSRLIEKISDELHHIRPSRIAYLTFSKEKSKKQAYVEKVKGMYEAFVNFEYAMCIHLENWMSLSASEKEVLIYHELLHIPDGGFDPDSKKYKKLRDHDVKDFTAVVEKFGIHWEDSAKILSMKSDTAENTEDTENTEE